MTLLHTGCAVIALAVATPALAQTPSQADLADLVRAQAAEIAALKARLDRIEGQQVAAATPAPVTTAPTPTSTTSPATPPVAVAQATPDPRRTIPFAPQLVPPGPADRDVAQAAAARDQSPRVTVSTPSSAICPRGVCVSSSTLSPAPPTAYTPAVSR